MEKNLPSPAMEEMVGRDSQLTENSAEVRPWKTTLIRLGPVSGVMAMGLAVASIVASLGILAGSNGRPIVDWSTPPSTYLAIFTAIANLSIRYAAIQGVVIGWWRRALKGSTLPKLHQDWRSGTTLRGAVTAGRNMGFLGLACVFSTIVIIDGPLLQRSSTVRTAPIYGQTALLNVSMAPEVPHGQGGSWATSKELGRGSYRWTTLFNATIPTTSGPVPNRIQAIQSGNGSLYIIGGWQSGNTLDGVVRGCPGKCKVQLQAPALFPTSCTTNVIPLRLNQNIGYDAILDDETAPPFDHNTFIVDISLVVDGEREVINLITGFAPNVEHCEGLLNYTICTLESGIGLYELDVDQDNKILLQNFEPPTLVALANNTAVNRTWDPEIGAHLSTLANIVYSTIDTWECSISWTRAPDGEMRGVQMGSLTYTSFSESDSSVKCAAFRDPRQDVLRSLNTLMLWTGAYTAKSYGTSNSAKASVEASLDPGVSIKYTTPAQVVGDRSIFHTDYSYFSGAAVVELICIAFILPTYWGWWKIGRSVSFSPLEMAKAFESPMLSDFNSNTSGRDLAKAADDSGVKYGATELVTNSRRFKLAFGASDSVISPTGGMPFESQNTETAHRHPSLKHKI